MTLKDKNWLNINLFLTPVTTTYEVYVKLLQPCNYNTLKFAWKYTSVHRLLSLHLPFITHISEIPAWFTLLQHRVVKEYGLLRVTEISKWCLHRQTNRILKIPHHYWVTTVHVNVVNLNPSNMHFLKTLPKVWCIFYLNRAVGWDCRDKLPQGGARVLYCVKTRWKLQRRHHTEVISVAGINSQHCGLHILFELFLPDPTFLSCFSPVSISRLSWLRLTAPT